MQRFHRWHSRAYLTAKVRCVLAIPSPACSLRLSRRIFGFTFGYWQGGKQVLLQMLVKGRIVAPDPLEYHRSVFFFLITVVGEDMPKGLVGRRFNALLVPVDSLEFLHQTHNRAVEVSGLGCEIVSGL